MYITIEDDIITGIYCGRRQEGFIEVPDSFSGFVGDSIDKFDNTWERVIEEGIDNPVEEKPLTLIEEIEKGIRTLEKGYKVDGDNIVAMSLVEKINAGIEKLPVGWKIDGDMISEMREEEKIIAGILPIPAGFEILNGTIHEIETEEVLLKREQTELESYLESTDWYVTRMIERNVEIPDEVKAKRMEAVNRLNNIKENI